jgi:hypothetical protein
MTMSRRAALVGLGGVALASARGRALAQSYPAHPIKYVVPYPPGALTTRSAVSSHRSCKIPGSSRRSSRTGRAEAP